MRRRLLHRRVANVLEQIYDKQLSEVAGQLATHYGQAGEAAKSVNYLLMAAEHASARFAHEEALHALNRALAIVTAHDHSTRYQLLLKRANIYHLHNKTDLLRLDVEALEELLEAEDEDAGRCAEVAILRTHYLMRSGDYKEAVTVTQQGVKQARIANLPRLEAEHLFYCGRVHWYMGLLESASGYLQEALASAREAAHTHIVARALEMLSSTGCFSGMSTADLLHYLEQSLALYCEIGDLGGEVSVLSKMGYVLVDQGDGAYDQSAENFYQRSILLARQIGDRDWQGISLSDLGALYTYRGRYDLSMQYLSAALACVQNEHRIREAIALEYMGFDAINQGDFSQALHYLESAQTMLVELGSLQWQAKALNDLALAHYYLGEFSRARSYAEQAIAVTQQVGDKRQEGHAQSRLGAILRELESFEDAMRCYQQAWRLHFTMGQFNHGMKPLAGLAEIAWRLGEHQEAFAYVEQILAHLHHDALERTDESLGVYMSCYHILHANQDPRAQEVLLMAHEQLQRRAATLDSEEKRKRFWEVPTHTILSETMESLEAIPPTHE
jgi:tetratricopeptide (TPR) repeat protein